MRRNTKCLIWDLTGISLLRKCTAIIARRPRSFNSSPKKFEKALDKSLAK